MSDVSELVVKFSADLSNLTSGIDNAKSQISSVGNATEEAAAKVATASDEMATAIQKTAVKFNALGTASKEASSGYNPGNTVSGLDVAQAKLTLFESKVQEARDKLQTLQNSADAGKAVTGIPEAQAQLTLLEARAQEARASMQEMAAGATQATSEISAGTTQAAEHVAQLATAAEESSGGFLGGIGKMAGGLLEFGQKLGMTLFSFQAMGQMASQLAQGLLGPAISAETVTTALTTLDGSAKAAGEEMQVLNAFAAKTPFKTLDIDQAAQQLQGFGTKAKDVVPEITAIGDALGSVGRETPAELDSVVQIFGKIRTEGKVTAMTMNELAVHGINGWQALADATGKTIPQVKELVKKGLLPANQAVDDLTKGIEMNPLYKGGMAKAAGTFTGLLSTLQSNFAQVLASFGSPIITALEGQLNNLGNLLASPGFQSFAGSIGKGIVLAFQGIGSAVSNVVGYFKNFDLGALVSSFEHLGGAIGKIIGPFTQLGSNKAVGGFFTTLKNDLSQGIVAGITTVSNAVNGLSQILTSLASNSAVKGFLGALGSGFQQVSQIVGGQLQANFKMFLGIAQDLGKWWTTTMAPAIAAAMPGFLHLGSVIATTLVPALAKIWAVGQQVARDILPYFISAFKTLAPIVVQVGGFIADNLGKAIQFLAPYIVSAAQAIGQFASDIASRVAPIIQGLWKNIMDGINFLLPIWKALWPTISGILQGVWNVMSGTIKVAWAVISGIVKVGLDLLSGNWKQAWTDIKTMFAGIWDGIKTVLSGVWGGIWSIIKGGINFVIGLLNDFIGGIDSIGIDVGPVHVHPNVPKIPFLAGGGFLQPGQLGVAGEAGPELLMGGPGGTSVMSNSASRGALGGAPVIHNHIYIDGRELADHTMVQVLSVIRGGGHPVGGAF